MLSHHCEMHTARRSCGWRLACLQAVGVLNEHVLLSKTFEVDFAKLQEDFHAGSVQLDPGSFRPLLLFSLFYLKIHLCVHVHAAEHTKLMFVCLGANSMCARIDTDASVCGPPSCWGPLAQARLYLGGWFSLFLYLGALLAGWERPTTGICCLCVWPLTFR